MTSFQQPPPIDDLSDLSWRRLEEEVLAAAPAASLAGTAAKAPRFSTRAVVTAVAVSLCAAAALLLLLTIKNDDSATTARLPLSRLVTEAAPSTMSVGDATLRAEPHTALVVSDGGKDGVRVVLERGAVHFTVAPRAGRGPFVVSAGAVTVEVVGTTFRVERAGEGAIVTVVNGRVRVLSSGVLHELGAGERFPAKLAALDPPSETTSDDIDDDSEDSDETSTPPPQAKTTAKPAAASAKERYAEAAALEGANPAKALAIYQKLSAERSPWAANALFALARLELERGQKARAHRALNRYLKRYPGGANAADARALLERDRQLERQR